LTPAALTSTSTGPNASSTSAKAASMPAASVTSMRTGRAVPPSPVISSAVRVAASCRPA
jgi:hypothetical protein